MKFNKMNLLRKKFHYYFKQKLRESRESINSAAVNNESGQTFIEFLLLLLILITLSMGMVSGFNNTVGKQWRALVKAIALPNDNNDFEL